MLTVVALTGWLHSPSLPFCPHNSSNRCSCLCFQSWSLAAPSHPLLALPNSDVCCASFSSSVFSISFAHFLVVKTLLGLGLKHSIIFHNWATEHLPVSRKSRTWTKVCLKAESSSGFYTSKVKFIPARSVDCTGNKHRYVNESTFWNHHRCEDDLFLSAVLFIYSNAIKHPNYGHLRI